MKKFIDLKCLVKWEMTAQNHCPIIEISELQFNGCPSFLEMFERLEHLKSFEITNYT